MTVAETTQYSDAAIMASTEFRAVLTDKQLVAEFKDFAKGAYSLLSELVFDINAEGIVLRQLDSSKACMVFAEFKSSFFTHYEFHSKHADEVRVCVVADGFKRAVEKAKDGLELAIGTISDPHSKKGKRDAGFEITAISDLKQTESLRMLTPPDEKTKQPNLQLEGSLHMMAGTFNKVLRDVSRAKKSHIRFILSAYEHENEMVGKVLKRGLTLFASDDEGELNYEFLDGDEVIWNFYLMNGKTQSTFFAVNYLDEARKLFNKKDELKIQTSTNRPLVVTTETREGKTITFILAPRVERR